MTYEKWRDFYDTWLDGVHLDEASMREMFESARKGMIEESKSLGFIPDSEGWPTAPNAGRAKGIQIVYSWFKSKEELIRHYIGRDQSYAVIDYIPLIKYEPFVPVKDAPVFLVLKDLIVVGKIVVVSGKYISVAVGSGMITVTTNELKPFQEKYLGCAWSDIPDGKELVND